MVIYRLIDGLKARVARLETVENELLSSQTEVRHLQQQLRMYRQDSQFIGSVQDRLVSYEDLQHQVQLLREENGSLRKDRTNSDLLRYQAQRLQNRCTELEGVMEEVARLRAENSQLLNKDGSKDASSVLQSQLSELQQREIVSLSKYGELATR